jgi:hypothetical protein
MPSIHDLKTSKFLKKTDLGDDEEMILTVKRLELEVNVGTEEKPDYKNALHFEELDKAMVMNWTNLQLASIALKTEDYTEWVGKRLLVWFDPSVQFKGEIKGGLRIRKAPSGTPAAPKKSRQPGEDDVPWPE